MKRVLKWFSLLAFVAMSFAPYANGGFVQQVKIQGTVADMEKKSIILKTSLGKIRVPRKYFKKVEKKIRPGKAVEIEIDLAEIVSYNKKNPVVERKK